MVVKSALSMIIGTISVNLWWPTGCHWAPPVSNSHNSELSRIVFNLVVCSCNDDSKDNTYELFSVPVSCCNLSDSSVKSRCCERQTYQRESRYDGRPPAPVRGTWGATLIERKWHDYHLYFCHLSVTSHLDFEPWSPLRCYLLRSKATTVPHWVILCFKPQNVTFMDPKRIWTLHKKGKKKTSKQTNIYY